MKRLLTMGLLLLSWQLAQGQHDLYKWQLSGYTGIAVYGNEANRFSDYYSVHDNLLYRAELTRSIGNSLGLSVGYALGNVRGRYLQQNAFETEVRMAALRAYFYTDNGWLLNSSARVSPYVFGGYGLSMLETASEPSITESRYVSTIPLGIGLKFRLSERWQLGLQTEAVYLTDPHLKGPALEQNDYNSAYLHTGLVIGYSFGFRKSTFKAQQYYSGVVARSQAQEQAPPQQNVLEMMLKLPAKTARVERDETTGNLTRQPERAQRAVFAPADTLAIRSTAIDVTDSNAVQGKPVVQGVPTQTSQMQDTASLPAPSAGVAVTKDIPSEKTADKVTQKATQPIPTASERSTLRPDTVLTQQAAPVMTQQQQPTDVNPEKSSPKKGQATSLKTEDKAPSKDKVENSSKTTARTRVKERVVYVQDAAGEAAQRDRQKQQLAAVNAENRRIQARLDSLQTMLPVDDTLQKVAVADTSMVRYLQRQAALNDSVLHRLNQYEQELAALKQQAKAVPVSVPAAAIPAVAVPAAAVLPAEPNAYTTTVYYPINSFQVPLESMRDLNQVVTKLQELPASTAQLTGFSSQSGNAAYNMALSRRRVEALVDFLTVQGIDKARIRVQYMGDAAASQKENPLDRKVKLEIVE